MLYQGIEVLEINPVVFIKDKATENWRKNERYVENKISKFNFDEFAIENPINDLVYLYFKDKDWTVEKELLIDIYKKLSKVFEEVKINLYLDNWIEEIGNSVDLTLEEFLNVLV